MNLDRKITLLGVLIIVPVLSYYVYSVNQGSDIISQHVNKNAIKMHSSDVAEKKSLKILALGDSLTEGYQIRSQDAYPRLLEIYLNSKFKNYNTKVINAGISGSTTASAVTRLEKFLDQDVDVMLLALGSNDGLRGQSVSAMKDNLQKTITLAKSNNIKVVLAGMRIPPNYGFKYTREFEESFKDLAEKNKLPFIPFFLKGVGGKPEFNIPDRIHPNEKGHQIILKTITPYFEEFYI